MSIVSDSSISINFIPKFSACSLVFTDVGIPTIWKLSDNFWPIKSTAIFAVDPVPNPTNIPFFTRLTASLAAFILAVN